MKRYEIVITALVLLFFTMAMFIPRIFEDGIAIGNNATTITMDGSGNMKFADAVSGNLLLSELEGGGGTTDHTALTNIGDSTHAELEDALIRIQTDLYDTIQVSGLQNATFGLGANLSGDVAIMVVGANMGMFEQSNDSLTAVQASFICDGTSGSVAARLWYGTDPYGTGTAMLAATTVTTSGGQVDVTTWTVDEIPPGNWIWAELTTVTTAPTQVIINFRYLLH